MTPAIGTEWYVSPWWVIVTGYTPRNRFVRYRRITRKGAPLAEVERLSLARWGREARPA